MNFSKRGQREEPEINLIPMLDVLLVIIIFLMLTTSYANYTGIEINLPTADTKESSSDVKEIQVAISAAGQMQINQQNLVNTEVATIIDALRQAAEGAKTPPIVIINADAKSEHQRTIDVLQAAQVAGLPHVTFATQKPNK